MQQQQPAARPEKIAFVIYYGGLRGRPAGGAKSRGSVGRSVCRHS